MPSAGRRSSSLHLPSREGRRYSASEGDDVRVDDRRDALPVPAAWQRTIDLLRNLLIRSVDDVGESAAT